jgi:parallel beta-helix repeat protein
MLSGGVIYCAPGSNCRHSSVKGSSDELPIFYGVAFGRSAAPKARWLMRNGRCVRRLRRLLSSVANAVCLCCLVGLSSGWAAPFHVDAKTGNDSYPGTSAKPFKTIKRASEVLRAGDKALIRGGVYHEEIVGGRSGTPKAPITYEGVAGEQVILQGSVRVRDWRKQGKVWTKYGLKPIVHDNAFVMVDEKKLLKRVDSPLRMPEGSFYLDRLGGYTVRLTGDADPNRDHRVEVYELNVAFSSGDRWGGTAKKWIVLRNLIVEKYGGHSISADPRNPSDNSHWELDRLTLRYNLKEGVFHCLDDWYVHDCKFVRNGAHGCQIDGARVRFVNNTASHNEWFGPSTMGGVGLLIGPDKSAHSCVVKNNIFAHNGSFPMGYGCGIYLEGRSHRNLIEGNLIVGNTADGVGFYGSSYNKVINNVIVNVAPKVNTPPRPDGGGVSGAFVVGHSYEGVPTQSVGNLIAHNTVWGCSAPVAAFPSREPLAKGELNRFVNNAFVNCRFLSPLPEPATALLENNGWFSCPISGDRFSPDVKSNLEKIPGIRGERPRAIPDRRPVTGHDPKLRNPTKGDFRLRPDSPLIDSGLSLTGVKRDRDGNPRPAGSAPDIGAYEYSRR